MYSQIILLRLADGPKTLAALDVPLYAVRHLEHAGLVKSKRETVILATGKVAIRVWYRREDSPTPQVSDDRATMTFEPVWRKSPIGSDHRGGARTRRPPLGWALAGAVAVLLLGWVIALGSQGEAVTNRAASSGGVRVDLVRSTLGTFASNGATDHSEPDRSLAGNAVLLIATPTPTLTPISALTPLPIATPTVELTAASDPPPAPVVPSDTGDISVTIIGDSIVLATETDLRTLVPDLDFFAQVGLQVSGGIVALQERADAGSLGQTVVIDLGNNGAFTSNQFDAIMMLVGANRRIFFVNVKVPRPWGDTNNQLLAQKVAQYSNASLLDWHGASIGHPEYFAVDGLHLGPKGVKALTNLLLAALS